MVLTLSLLVEAHPLTNTKPAAIAARSRMVRNAFINLTDCRG
jgi:hypothetical protein